MIFRAIISDLYNTKVGWYWLKLRDSVILDKAAIFLMLNDLNENVKLGALSFINQFWKNEYLKFIQALLKNKSNKIVAKTIEILEKKGNKSSLKLLNPLLSNPNREISKGSWLAQFAILLRNDSNKAILFLLSYKDLRHNYYKYLENNIERLTRAQLEKMKKDPSDSIKEIAYSFLLDKNWLSLNEIKDLANSKNIKIRKKALLMELHAGQILSPEKINQEWPQEN